MYTDIKRVNVEKIQSESRTDSEAALRCGGWNARRLLEHGESIEEAGSSEQKAGGCPRDVAVYKIDVPEFGTYKVDVTISAGKEAVKNLALFAGRRNLIDYGVSIDEGKDYIRTFYQAVIPYIPALCAERCNDKCILVSVACVTQVDLKITVTREDVPIIWVAGDSTLTDQNAGIPYYPYGSCAGWAQTLQRFIDGAAVCNLAHSGMTTNCFRDDGHYDIVKEMIKPGDLFIMQFGHNDQKRRNLKAYGGYADNLRRYVEEVRELGAEPIICSPISRIPLELPKIDTVSEQTGADGAKYYSLLEAYAGACKEVAHELEAAFIDLHKLTFEKWISDIDASHDFFMPGDITHTNEYGAVLISEYFIEEIRKISQSSLGAEKLALFDNHRQYAALLPESDSKILPKELPGPDIFALEPPYVDFKDIAEYEGIKKAYRLGLLDPCVMHLHPFATMPRAQLLMPLFRAFGKEGVRPYKGHFTDISFDEWDSGYVQALVEMGIAEGNLFRPDAPITYEEFDDLIKKLMRTEPELYEGIEALKVLRRTADVHEPYGLAKENEITRAEVYMALANIMEKRGEAAKEIPSDAEVHPVH